MRRRKHAEAFSLFSFQDIITSVTGILILLTLFLTLQLVQRKSFGTATPAAAAEESQEAIQTLDSQIEQLQRELNDGKEFLADFATLSPASLGQEERQLRRTIATLQAEIAQLQSQVGLAQEQVLSLSASTPEANKDDLSRLRSTVLELTRQLNNLRSSKRVVYNVAPNPNKAAWLVELLEGKIKVMKPGTKTERVDFEAAAGQNIEESFLEWAQTHDASSEYFVLLVRPKSLSTYRRVFKKLDELHFAIGVDLIERDATLVDISHIAPGVR